VGTTLPDADIIARWRIVADDVLRVMMDPTPDMGTAAGWSFSECEDANAGAFYVTNTIDVYRAMIESARFPGL